MNYTDERLAQILANAGITQDLTEADELGEVGFDEAPTQVLRRNDRDFHLGSGNHSAARRALGRSVPPPPAAPPSKGRPSERVDFSEVVEGEVPTHLAAAFKAPRASAFQTPLPPEALGTERQGTLPSLVPVAMDSMDVQLEEADEATKPERTSRKGLYGTLALAAACMAGFWIAKPMLEQKSAPKAAHAPVAAAAPVELEPAPVKRVVAPNTPKAEAAEPTASEPIALEVTIAARMPTARPRLVPANGLRPSAYAAPKPASSANAAPTEAPKADEKAAPDAKPEAADKPASEEAPKAEFSKVAAVAALSGVQGRAAACVKAGGPTGPARVSITFAPSGRVTRAMVVGKPYAGTPTGGCIAQALRSARVPAYEGSLVTVIRTLRFLDI